MMTDHSDLYLELQHEGRLILRLRDQHDVQIGFEEVDLNTIHAEHWKHICDPGICLRQASGKSAEQHLCQQAGSLIHDIFLSKEIYRQLTGLATPHRLTIHLPLNDKWSSMVAQIPWEAARASSDAKALHQQNFQINYVFTNQTVKHKYKEELRILFLYAADDVGQSSEQRKIRQKISSLFTRKIFPKRRITYQNLSYGANIATLRKTLRSHKTFDIIYLCTPADGSGPKIQAQSTAWENLPGSRLVEFFTDCGIDAPALLILASCSTPEYATALTPYQHALPLLQKGVGAVLALRQTLPSEDLSTLTITLFDSLLAHENPADTGQAVNLVRKDLHKDSHPLSALSPILFGNSELKLAPAASRNTGNSVDMRYLPEAGYLERPPSFVGQEQELAKLAACWLADEAHYAVAQIIGGPGTGKTRLAAELIAESENQFKWIIPFQIGKEGLSYERMLEELHLRLLHRQNNYAKRLQTEDGSAIFRIGDEHFQGKSRRETLNRNLIRALQEEAILLVLDGFERQLELEDKPAYLPAKCINASWEELLEALTKADLSNTGSRILLTGRTPAKALEGRSLLISLQHWSPAQSRWYVNHLLQNKQTMTAEECQNLAHFSNGHPWLLHCLVNLTSQLPLPTRQQLLFKLGQMHSSYQFGNTAPPPGLQAKYVSEALNILATHGCPIEPPMPTIRMLTTSDSGTSSAAPQEGTQAIPPLLQSYIETICKRDATLRLPPASLDGSATFADIESIQIDLPLLSIHRDNSQTATSHTQSIKINQAYANPQNPSSCKLKTVLHQGKKLAILGEAGSGKSTLLQWLSYYYARSFTWDGAARHDPSFALPAANWIPVLISCRDLNLRELPTDLEGMLLQHLPRIFSSQERQKLSGQICNLAYEGRLLLLLDGLDDISEARKRVQFAGAIREICDRFHKIGLVVSSRPLGFSAVREHLERHFEHLKIAPLDADTRVLFIKRWATFMKRSRHRAHECALAIQHHPLAETMLLLALLFQIHEETRDLPNHNSELYMRIVRLMVSRCKHIEPLPDLNEINQHLAFLAWQMQTRNTQTLIQPDILNIFKELRRQHPDRTELHLRSPEELLRVCKEAVGILHEAGYLADNRGEHVALQFFHYSFQEYFLQLAATYGYANTSGNDIEQRVQALLKRASIGIKTIHFGDFTRVTELAMDEQTQEDVRKMIDSLREADAELAIQSLIPAVITAKARPYVVCALYCLKRQNISSATIRKIASALPDIVDAIDNGTNLQSSLNQALNTLRNSVYWPRLYEGLLTGFLTRKDWQRGQILGQILCLLDDGRALDTKAVEQELKVIAPRLSQADRRLRLEALFHLINLLFNSRGRLGHIPRHILQPVSSNLLQNLNLDEASGNASLLALVWLTGCKNTAPVKESFEQWQNSMIWISPDTCRDLETLPWQKIQDWGSIARLCLLQSREQGVKPVYAQRDWIYHLAEIADGDRANASLPQPSATDWKGRPEAMTALLRKPPPAPYDEQIALTMGSLGILAPEMVEPLLRHFHGVHNFQNSRDEAMIYLGLLAMRGINAAAILAAMIKASDTPPQGKDHYLYTRGMFGLIWINHVKAMGDQIRKALPHSDLRAYAYAIAGSKHETARAILSDLQRWPSPKVQNAATAGLQKMAEFEHKEKTVAKNKTPGIWERIRRWLD